MTAPERPLPYRAWMIRYFQEQEPEDFETYDQVMGYVSVCVEFNSSAPLKVETPDGVLEGKDLDEARHEWEREHGR